MSASAAPPVTAGDLLTLPEHQWVNYHLEHHLMVFVPCWKLRQVHAILLAKGYGPRMEMASSYLDVIRHATSAR